MKICLYRTRNGFVPDSEHDEQALSSVRIGDRVYGDVKQPRNPGHHRKAFALLHTMFDSQEKFDSFPAFVDWVKVRAGLVDLVEINETGAVYKLQSLSYANMDQARFSEVYEALVTVAYETLGMEILEQFA